MTAAARRLSFLRRLECRLAWFNSWSFGPSRGWVFQLAEVEAMAGKRTMPPPSKKATTKTKPTPTALVKKDERAQKPHPMYVQMVLLRRMPSEKLQSHIHYLFGCVPGPHFVWRSLVWLTSSAGHTSRACSWWTPAEAFDHPTRSRPLRLSSEAALIWN